ncbi:integrase/recombinase xerD homolog [Lissotriton helveticus]
MGERSLAPGTRKRYASHLATFHRVVLETGAAGLTLENRVRVFVVWARKQGRSHSWVTGHLAAVSHDSKLTGAQDPAKSFVIRAALKGWARDEPRAPDDRSPIDFPTLQDMLDALGPVTHSSFEASLFAAAFVLAFFGAFRSSEIVARSRNDRSGDALGVDDIKIEGALSITLRKSKTDQAGKGIAIHLAPLGDPRYCPVTLVQAFLALRPPGPGYLLIHVDRSPLTRYQMEEIMIACLSRAGLLDKGKKFSSHSFRIGAATAAFKAGMQPESVQKVGRWQSLCYKKYIHP